MDLGTVALSSYLNTKIIVVSEQNRVSRAWGTTNFRTTDPGPQEPKTVQNTTRLA